MNECAVIRDLLPLYLEDAVSEESRQEIERHLDGCAGCRAVLEQDGACHRVPKQPKKRVTKRAVWVTALLLTGLAVLAVLWFSHAFFFVGSFASPDGAVTTRVYDRDISEFIPAKDHFTLVDQGAFSGKTVLWGSFDGLWWSADGKYQVVSLLADGECWLTVFDYVRNTGSNLDNRLRSGIYEREEFSDAVLDDVEFRFVQWSPYDSNMLIYFSYVNQDGLDRDGYFWYRYADGTVSGIAFLETVMLAGTIKEVGETFYLMDLDEPDENGNIVEFVFRVTDATRMAGLEVLQPGDHVRLVCRGGEEYTAQPWDLSFAEVQTTAYPDAISVTVAP